MIPRGLLLLPEQFDGATLIRLAQQIDASGYESIWLPELFGREPFATAGFLLAHTRRIRVGTGIANVYARDAAATTQARQTLAELSGGRFLLGLGVSNAHLNTGRGHTWEPPLKKMRQYLDDMENTKVFAPSPEAPCPTFIAAHGPLLQRLSAERADGIFTYLMTPTHAAAARNRIGATSTLNTVAMFLAETDPDVARRKARGALKPYIGLDYYHRAWREDGFTDADFAEGGSDRLIDTLVAWGDPQQLRARLTAFEAAGASRIIIVPLGLKTRDGYDDELLNLLEPRVPASID